MICNPGFHSRSNAQRLVNLAEVVEHEVKADGVHVVLQLLGERIG